jgi:hypothetical protein
MAINICVICAVAAFPVNVVALHRTWSQKRLTTSRTAWRGQLQGIQKWGAHLPLVDGDIYQFGVFNGDSMKELRTYFPGSTMWGFDSFQGIPSLNDDNDVRQKDFEAGAYKAAITPESLRRQIAEPERVSFIVGFYNESLTPSLKSKKHMKPAKYIDVDADLYSSSYQALDWMFSNGLVQPGTLIGYDDWWVNPCSKGGESLTPLDTGEGRAHLELAEKYSVRFRCIVGSCMPDSVGGWDGWPTVKGWDGWGPIFQVVELGNGIADHGFRMNATDIKDFKENDSSCQHHHQSQRHELALY